MSILRGFPRLCVLSPMCNKFLRFTSTAIPVPLLMARMATNLLFTYLYKHWWHSNSLRHAGSAILSVMLANSKCEQYIEFTDSIFVSYVALVIAIGQCERLTKITRKHSSGMLTTRLLTRGGVLLWHPHSKDPFHGTPLDGTPLHRTPPLVWHPPRSTPPGQSPPTPCGQNDCHMHVKIFPCPTLHLRAVKKSSLSCSLSLSVNVSLSMKPRKRFGT